MAFQDLDRVADPDGARSVRDHVLPEDQLLAEPAAPATTTLGRNRFIGTGGWPSPASQSPSASSEPALVSSSG